MRRSAPIFRTIVRLAKRREELRIVADQFGAPTSAAIIADTIAAMFADARGVSDVIASAGGLVHLTASDSTSWHGFATAIVEGLQAGDVPLKVARDPADRHLRISGESAASAQFPPRSQQSCPICWVNRRLTGPRGWRLSSLKARLQAVKQ